MYLHTGASEGACQFWNYHDKVQVEGCLLALLGYDHYLNLLGNPGSNTIDLFWDSVNVLHQVRTR